MNGADLIAAERKRQVEQEGWSPQHDDEHDLAELLAAACCYAGITLGMIVEDNLGSAEPVPSLWRWHPDWWKPSDDPVRNLVKAGALIAAEIDRLQRADGRREQ